MTPKQQKQQMIDDLGRHFRRKLEVLISDTAEVFEIAELSPREFITTVLATLMTEAADFCSIMEMDPHKFRQMCDLALTHAIKNKASRAQKKESDIC